MNSEPFVAVIVLNWNGWVDTVECIKSLLGMNYRNFSIVICDNGSTDGSQEKICDAVSKMAVKFTLLERNKSEQCLCAASTTPEIAVVQINIGENLGFAAGNNIGVRFAQGRWSPRFVWLLNNDTEVTEGSLRAVVSVALKDERIGICGSKLLYWHDRDQVQALGGGVVNRVFALTHEVKVMCQRRTDIHGGCWSAGLDYISGAAMLVSDKFLRVVGLMEERYFLYFEEVDWAERAKKSGFQIAYSDDSIVFHKEGASIGTNAKNPKCRSKVSDYYGVRSRVLFTHKFFPCFLPMLYIALLIAVLRRFWRMQPARAFMIMGVMLRPWRRL